MDAPLRSEKAKKTRSKDLLEKSEDKIQSILSEESTVLTEESITIIDNSVSENITEDENVLLVSLKNAYMSNIIAQQIGEKVCNKRIRVLYNKLLKGKRYHSDFAKVITHLYTGKFVGNYSYTFKREIIILNSYNLNRLDSETYLWPEVFNNRYLLSNKPLIDTYRKMRDAEYTSIEEILRSGKIISPYQNQERVCYKPVDNCTLETCKLITKREIYMSEMQGNNVVAYCFDEIQLFDLILAEIHPINPYTKKKFPEHLVTNIRRKYKNELLMRAYYIISITEKQKKDKIHKSISP